MNEGFKRFPRFTPFGERALLVEFDDQLTLSANGQVRSLDFYLSQNPIKGVSEWVPGYSSLLVHYDPRVIQLAAVQNWVEGGLAIGLQEVGHPPKMVELLVHYGGEDGPDLPYVAEYHHLTPDDVVLKHTSPVYRVGMMGFMPGFAYLLGLDPTLATPRLSTPRTHIPAGSVGIAGYQTGVYPLDSPGGWQLIGRTAQALYDPGHEPYFALSPGDQVRFIPIKN